MEKLKIEDMEFSDGSDDETEIFSCDPETIDFLYNRKRYHNDSLILKPKINSLYTNNIPDLLENAGVDSISSITSFDSADKGERVKPLERYPYQPESNGISIIQGISQEVYSNINTIKSNELSNSNIVSTYNRDKNRRNLRNMDIYDWHFDRGKYSEMPVLNKYSSSPYPSAGSPNTSLDKIKEFSENFKGNTRNVKNLYNSRTTSDCAISNEIGTSFIKPVKSSPTNLIAPPLIETNRKQNYELVENEEYNAKSLNEYNFIEKSIEQTNERKCGVNITNSRVKNVFNYPIGRKNERIYHNFGENINGTNINFYKNSKTGANHQNNINSFSENRDMIKTCESTIEEFNSAHLSGITKERETKNNKTNVTFKRNSDIAGNIYLNLHKTVKSKCGDINHKKLQSQDSRKCSNKVKSVIKSSIKQNNIKYKENEISCLDACKQDINQEKSSVVTLSNLGKRESNTHNNKGIPLKKVNITEHCQTVLQSTPCETIQKCLEKRRFSTSTTKVTSTLLHPKQTARQLREIDIFGFNNHKVEAKKIKRSNRLVKENAIDMNTLSSFKPDTKNDFVKDRKCLINKTNATPKYKQCHTEENRSEKGDDSLIANHKADKKTVSIKGTKFGTKIPANKDSGKEKYCYIVIDNDRTKRKNQNVEEIKSCNKKFFTGNTRLNNIENEILSSDRNSIINIKTNLTVDTGQTINDIYIYPYSDNASSPDVKLSLVPMENTALKDWKIGEENLLFSENVTTNVFSSEDDYVLRGTHQGEGLSFKNRSEINNFLYEFTERILLIYNYQFNSNNLYEIFLTFCQETGSKGVMYTPKDNPPLHIWDINMRRTLIKIYEKEIVNCEEAIQIGRNLKNFLIHLECYIKE